MKHIFILRLIRKEDGSLISERDMDTMAEKDKDEAVNELNGNSVGYLGYQKQKTAQAVGEVDKHEKKRAKNKMAENRPGSGV